MARNFVDIDVAQMFFKNSDNFFDFETDKKKLIEHMETLKNQSVEESTLYKKWLELKSLNNTKDIVKSGILKNILWAPTDIYDREQTIKEIKNLKPKIVICEEGTELYDTWKYLRLLIHTMSWSSGIGRLIKILVFDENTNKVIGLASIASDVISVGVRDEWIGWTAAQRQGGKLKNTAIASTIVASQPLGYNFLGVKLIASLLTTEDIRNAWENKFGDKLAGITTTSLYGSHSVYQRIPFWKELGKTTGKILLSPDDNYYEKWSNWLKENHLHEYEECVFGKAGEITTWTNDYWAWVYDGQMRDAAPTREELVEKLRDQKFSVHKDNVVYDLRGQLVHPPSGPKQNVINRVFKKLGMKVSDYQHGFKRGVYFAPLYENTQEYLCDEIGDDELIKNKKLENEIDSVMEWWIPKAIRRYENLLDSGRIKPESLYYREMITMTSWDQVKKTYLGEVGR